MRSRPSRGLLSIRNQRVPRGARHAPRLTARCWPAWSPSGSRCSRPWAVQPVGSVGELPPRRATPKRRRPLPGAITRVPPFGGQELLMSSGPTGARGRHIGRVCSRRRTGDVENDATEPRPSWPKLGSSGLFRVASKSSAATRTARARTALTGGLPAGCLASPTLAPRIGGRQARDTPSPVCSRASRAWTTRSLISRARMPMRSTPRSGENRPAVTCCVKRPIEAARIRTSQRTSTGESSARPDDSLVCSLGQPTSPAAYCPRTIRQG